LVEKEHNEWMINNHGLIIDNYDIADDGDFYVFSQNARIVF
jgi:hypothetical protein